MADETDKNDKNDEQKSSEPKPVGYDERIYRKGHPPHQTRNALILIVLILVGTYFAVNKSVPWTSDYEVKATFDNAANVRKGSPVRIAGVNVGEVKSVRRARATPPRSPSPSRRRASRSARTPRSRSGRESSSKETSSSTSSRAARARPSSRAAATSRSPRPRRRSSSTRS